jgi:hypothetical protein
LESVPTSCSETTGYSETGPAWTILVEGRIGGA